jgi:hypothetical protein
VNEQTVSALIKRSPRRPPASETSEQRPQAVAAQIHREAKV